ncbi:YdbH domain-containing protein [Sphingomonas sp. IW22]
MTAQAEEEPGAAPARRWWRLFGVPRRGRVPMAIALVLLIALVILWSQRRQIAADFIARELAARGVQARYDVTEIGTSTQRLENVVIGDPARPDLVADWIEVRTRLGLGAPEVTGVDAGRVRLRAVWRDGRLSLGALDRMMPPPSGKPFTLPELDVKIADGGARIETPLGVLNAKLSGQGQLSDGFDGRLALAADRLSAAGCRLAGARAAMDIAIRERRIALAGPVRATGGACGDNLAQGLGLTVDVQLPEALDRWSGKVGLAVDRLDTPAMRAASLGGTVNFAGNAARTEGRADIRAKAVSADQGSAADLTFAGPFRLGGGETRLAGRVSAARIRPDMQPISLRLAAGTPGSALAAELDRAVTAAARGLAGNADIALTIAGGRGALVVGAADLSAASGARIRFAGARGIGFGWPGNRLMLDGNLRGGGGGLPRFTAKLEQARPGGPIAGQVSVASFAAGGERVALSPVRFMRAADGGTRIATRMRATLALPGGRVEGLDLPLDLRWDGGTQLALAPGCVPMGMDRLMVSSLDLRAVALRLCPLGSTLFRQGPGGMAAGARIAASRVAGTLGGSPLALAARTATVRLGQRLDFTFADVEARLGCADRLSRLSIGTLAGATTAGGIAGDFADAAGAIGNVPLNLSEGAGAWRFANGALTLDGTRLRVADAATPARFEPLAANDFRLTLADNQIDATGTLTAPEGGARVAGVTIAHDLGAGSGDAVLAVEDLQFDERLQPDALTRLVYGVIADVRGSVSGTGHIRWSPDGVTSDGVFRTAGTDLAAAFGPVTGLSGEIRFTDLLGLETESGVATIASVNPGIPVENGQVRYRLIGDQKVQVEGGRWPFAGGALTLDPTVIDLSTGKERRLTFHVEGVDAAAFLQQFEFDNLNATGTFDGTLPMIFDERGGRIEDGRLTVREGGGTIAYVGEVSQEDLGTWGNFAFESLKSLRYERLNLTLSGPLDGEMVTEIRFAGISQGEGASSNFIVRRLARLPLVFNVTVRAPFRQLLDSVRSYYEPSRLIERNLPALIEEQRKRDVQSPESESMP